MSARQTRALARQQKKLDQVDWSWKKWKRCEICGHDFCINCNWEDRKPRTNRYLGVVCCFNCDPRSTDPELGFPYMSDKIWDKDKYRIFMSYVFTKKLADQPCFRSPPGEPDVANCKCLSCAARKLIERTVPQ